MQAGVSVIDLHQVYPGAIPVDVDWLQPQRNAEIAIGSLLQAVFGTGTVVDGLAVTPTSPASMQVIVGPGCVIFNTTIDTITSGFASLTYDGTTPLVKAGINTAPTLMTALAAPPGAGQSQNWLIEAQFIEADTNPIALPFYNASNPAVPYTGPGGTGSASNTARTQRVQLQFKSAPAAASGAQMTAAPDAGWVGVAVVTVPNGASSLTAANITPYANAPVVPTKLPFMRKRLTAPLTLYVSPVGNDANSGLSAQTAFATRQAAWNYIVSSLDLNGFSVTVSCANGNYTDALFAIGVPTGAVGGLQNSVNQPGVPVTFLGNAGSPSSCSINVTLGNCFFVGDGASIAVNGFQLSAGGVSSDYNTNGVALCCFSSGGIQFSNVIFGTCATSHIFSSLGSVIQSKGSAYSIVGSAPSHIYALGNSTIATADSAVTLTGSPAFSLAFAYVAESASASCQSMTFAGSATGQRFVANTGGAVYTAGSGASYLPGSSAGAATTGYYV